MFATFDALGEGALSLPHLPLTAGAGYVEGGWFHDDQYCRAGGSESPACDELCFEGCCVPGIDFTDYETVPTSDGTPLETMDNGLDPFYENFADSLLERLNLEL